MEMYMKLAKKQHSEMLFYHFMEMYMKLPKDTEITC